MGLLLEDPEEQKYSCLVKILAFPALLFTSFVLVTNVIDTSEPMLRAESKMTTADHELFWGNYKPQYVHAVSQRDVTCHNPLSMNVIYRNPDDWEHKIKSRVMDNIRSEDFDDPITERGKKIPRFNWDYHDAESFGVHSSYDPDLDINFTSTFVKLSRTKDHQKWFDITRKGDFPNARHDGQKLNLIYTFGAQQFGEEKQLAKLKMYTYDKGWIIEVNSKTSPGWFWISVKRSGQIVAPANMTYNYQLFSVDAIRAWDVTTLVTESIKQFGHLPNVHVQASNMAEYPTPLIGLEFSFTRGEDYEVIINYDSRGPFVEEIIDYEGILNQRKQEFDKRLLVTIVKARDVSNENLECARLAVSNLLGGLSYNYGRIEINQPEFDRDQPITALWSATPSRTFFPRAFLWDEGFHESIICKWNYHICMEAIRSWLKTMFPNGWIPREQARGPEALSIYPNLKEDAREANPPTLLLPTLHLWKNHRNQTDVAKFFQEVFPKLKTWFEWFTNAQGVKDSSGEHTYYFKWWGPEEKMNLGSGMDDFPRSEHFMGKNYINKYSIDAHIWVLFFADSLAEMAKELDKKGDFITFIENFRKEVNRTLYEGMLDPADHLFKDVHTSIDHHNQKFSANLGYPSLFPLFFGHIKSDSEALSKTLDFLHDDKEIWTPWGVRSLSPKSENYGGLYNYWTKPIWIPINYLLLRGLNIYYADNDKAKVIHDQLRKNLIDNVCGNLRTYGFFFEHYDQRDNGRGNGYRHFTGWTTVISLIIGDNYD